LGKVILSIGFCLADRLAIDVGETFTDVVFLDTTSGAIRFENVLSTPFSLTTAWPVPRRQRLRPDRQTRPRAVAHDNENDLP
jgi:N-methylhydantoinase A/oxoprolinase/acetone carboxylase beta subunit